MKHRSTAVASQALELALRNKTFTVSELQRSLTNPPSRQTIYRILKQLQKDDWITCDGKTWKPDLKAQMLANTDTDDAKENRGFSLSADDVLNP